MVFRRVDNVVNTSSSTERAATLDTVTCADTLSFLLHRSGEGGGSTASKATPSATHGLLVLVAVSIRVWVRMHAGKGLPPCPAATLGTAGDDGKLT